jgi:hypothetical protein
MGKEPQRRHALDMQNMVKRYFEKYFNDKPLKQIDEIVLEDFLVYLKNQKKLSASTVNQARNSAFVALRYAKRRKIISTFDFDTVLRANGQPKERGILEKEEVAKLSRLAALSSDYFPTDTMGCRSSSFP